MRTFSDRLQALRFHLSEAWEGFRQTGVTNLASLSTVSVALFILGAFLLFMRNLNENLRVLRSQVQVTVYAAPRASSQEVDALRQKLESDPSVSELVAVSPEEALQSMKEWMGWEEMTLPRNPMPYAFDIELKEGTDFEAFLSRARVMPGADDLSVGEEEIGGLLKLLDLVRKVGLLLVLVLGTSSLLIIANTIKLTVYARRNEIDIMKLVGATDWYIRTPFLIEGFLQGLFGGLISLGILLVAYPVLTTRLHGIAPFLVLVDSPADLVRISYQILLMGIVLGLLGSLISLRRIAI